MKKIMFLLVLVYSFISTSCSVCDCPVTVIAYDRGKVVKKNSTVTRQLPAWRIKRNYYLYTDKVRYSVCRDTFMKYGVGDVYITYIHKKEHVDTCSVYNRNKYN